jgi:hypothetical protein
MNTINFQAGKFIKGGAKIIEGITKHKINCCLVCSLQPLRQSRELLHCFASKES